MTDLNALESLYFAALAKAPDERAAFLDEACAGNAELRGHLERLLAAQPQVGEFLEPPVNLTATFDPPGATTTAHGPTEAVGAVLAGKYKLTELIGEGGMGSVWLAQQSEPVKRKVAVKLIKPGMDSRQVLARFEAERQALALMDHPNIAKVLDGGLHENRPFFVMELVKGVPITEYCDARKLTPRERLELFVPVCQAIQHAHQKGVIHRDIKPSNVLIALYDDKPVPKVIDFGVAKATGGTLTEHTIETGFGGVVGTPQYMSPEQATLNNLDIDTRSDVYSLGVLLYELLTGSPPFARKELEKKGLLEILRVVREEEPPKPSTKLSTADAFASLSANRGTEPRKLAALLRSELDWIVLKALEKDRTRRYETANGFAADVNRYLAGEPVLAHPPSAGYRLRKFVRRNRLQMSAVGAVVVAILAGAGLAAWQAMVARAAERDAIAAREREAEQRVEAEKREAAAKDAEATTQEVLGFINEKVFAAAGPKGRWGGLGRDVKLREALDAAEKSITEKFAGRPLVELSIRYILGLTYQQLGDFDAMERQLRIWVDVCEQKLNRMHPQYPWQLNQLLILRGDLRSTDPARGPAARKRMEDAYQHYLRTVGPDDKACLQLALNYAQSLAHQPGRQAEAISLALDTLTRTQRIHPADSPESLYCEMQVANVYRMVGQTAVAIQRLEAALPRMKAVLTPDNIRIRNTLLNLGALYSRSKRHADAIRCYEEGLALHLNRTGYEELNLSSWLVGLSYSYIQVGRDADAVKLLEEHLPGLVEQLGLGHQDVAQVANNLTASLLRLERFDDVIRAATPCLQAASEKLGPDHHSVRLLKADLLIAAVYRDHPDKDRLLNELFDSLGRDHSAGAKFLVELNNELVDDYIRLKPGPRAVILKRGVELLEQKQQQPEWWTVRDPSISEALFIVRRNLATAYLDANEEELARPVIRAMLATVHTASSPESARLAVDLHILGELCNRVRDYSTAERLFGEALAVNDRIPLSQARIALIRNRLGLALFGLNRTEEAARELRAALDAFRLLEGPTGKNVMGVLTNLVIVYRIGDGSTRQPDRAEALLREFPEGVKSQVGPETEPYATTCAVIALNRLTMKNWTVAEAAARECLAIREKTQPDDWRTFNAKSILGAALLGQQKYADAEPLLLKGYEGMKAREKAIPEPSLVYYHTSIERLVELYSAMDKPDEVAKWRAERAKYPPEVAPPPRMVK